MSGGKCGHLYGHRTKDGELCRQPARIGRTGCLYHAGTPEEIHEYQSRVSKELRRVKLDGFECPPLDARQHIINFIRAMTTLMARGTISRGVHMSLLHAARIAGIVVESSRRERQTDKLATLRLIMEYGSGDIRASVVNLLAEPLANKNVEGVGVEGLKGIEGIDGLEDVDTYEVTDTPGDTILALLDKARELGVHVPSDGPVLHTPKKKLAKQAEGDVFDDLMTDDDDTDDGASGEITATGGKVTYDKEVE